MRHFLLAAVPAERLFRLRALDPARFVWEAASTWPEAVEAIRAKPVQMAVVDPLLGTTTPKSHGIGRLRQFFPSLPLLVYTELAPATAGVLLELGRTGIRRVVVHRFEDAPGARRRAHLAALEHSPSQQVLQGLDQTLSDLPPELRLALADLLLAPGEGSTVTALADRARLTRRTCERWFTKAGLPSPRVVMELARLLYAHRLLADPGYTVEDVALKLGYSKTKTLQIHLRAAFGLTAGEIRVSLTAEDALAMVLSRYFAPERRAAAS